MQNNQEVKFYEIFKKLAVIGAAFVMSISVTVSASAAELSYTDSTGKYKMIGINESDGDYRHAVTKTYNYSGGTRRVGSRVIQRETVNSVNLTESYSTGVIANNLYYQRGNNCSKSKDPHYSVHYSEWYNSSAYESGIAYNHQFVIRVIY